MTSPISFQIKSVNGEYVVWNNELRIISIDQNIDTAFQGAQKRASETLLAFAKADIPLTSINTAGSGDSITRMMSANLAAFAVKVALATIIIAGALVVAPRVLPTNGLADIASYLRLLPDERKSRIVENAKEIGELSRPVLEGIGLGCHCANGER